MKRKHTQSRKANRTFIKRLEIPNNWKQGHGMAMSADQSMSRSNTAFIEAMMFLSSVFSVNKRRTTHK